MVLIKLALRPWRTAYWNQILSGFAVATLLVLSGFLVWFGRGLQPVVARLQSDQIITAYVDPATSDERLKAIRDELRTSLGAQRAEIESVSQNEFLKKIKTHYPDLGIELEGMGSEVKGLLPKYVSIAGSIDDDTLIKIRSVNGVESVDTSQERYALLVGAFRALSKISYWLAVALGIALMTGLFQLSRTHQALQAESIQLLRLWGASPIVQMAPAMISGTLVGAFGGILAGLCWWGISRNLGLQLSELSPYLRDIGTPAPQFALILLGVGVLSGAISGLLGVRRSA
jgi:cell division protein FtsX